jgi:hypothetical protein
MVGRVILVLKGEPDSFTDKDYLDSLICTTRRIKRRTRP